MEEPADASASERAPSYKARADGRLGWARMLRRILDSGSPLSEAPLKQALPYEEGDEFAAIKANKTLQDIGEPSRPRQEAANLSSEALRESSKACPPYFPFFPPKLGGAPWAPQDPARRRAAGAEKVRQRRSGAQLSFLDTGRLAAPYLRYVVAGEVAGD